MQPCPTLRSRAGVNYGEAGRGLVPVALQIQMVFQPADELHGGPGEPRNQYAGQNCYVLNAYKSSVLPEKPAIQTTEI